MKSAIGVASIFITIVCLAILKNVAGIQDFITNGTGNFEMVTTFTFTVFIYAIIFNSLNTRSTGLNVFEHISEKQKILDCHDFHCYRSIFNHSVWWTGLQYCSYGY